jgi:hypothetical protein
MSEHEGRKKLVAELEKLKQEAMLFPARYGKEAGNDLELFLTSKMRECLVVFPKNFEQQKERLPSMKKDLKEQIEKSKKELELQISNRQWSDAGGEMLAKAQNLIHNHRAVLLNIISNYGIIPVKEFTDFRTRKPSPNEMSQPLIAIRIEFENNYRRKCDIEQQVIAIDNELAKANAKDLWDKA